MNITSSLTDSRLAAKQKRIKPLRVSCWRRNQAENAQGMAPVMLDLRLNGKEKAVHTGIYCKADSLKPKEFTITGDKYGTQFIQALRTEIEQAALKLSLTGAEIDLSKLAEIGFGKRGYTEQTPLFREVLEMIVTRYREQLGNGVTKGTMKSLTTERNKLIDFLRETGRIDLPLSEIKPAFIPNLFIYLKGQKGYSQNYANRVAKLAKRVMNYAEDNEWVTRNPLRNVRLRHEKPGIIYLSDREIEKLEITVFVDSTLELVRDGFLFQIYTGLAYTDLANVSKREFTEVDGEKCLRINRQKTGSSCLIPLLPPALDLLSKYEKHPVCQRTGKLIPTLSNPKMNVNLKALASVCGIQKHLTTHVGRKSAATFLLNNGISPVVVQAILGHASFTTTETHYAVTQEKTVIREMRELAERRFSTR